MNKSTSSFTIVAAFCGFLACIGDITIPFILGAFFPGYDFIKLSESFLGTTTSPVGMWMDIWSVCLGVLLIVFAIGLLKTLPQNTNWSKVLMWFIIFYGLGEGAGSGLFPNDYIGEIPTWTAKVHSVFGAIGGTGLALMPFASMMVFSKKIFPTLHNFSLFVLISGFLFIILFLMSSHELIPFKGLWQRIFLADYYSLMIVLAVRMKKIQRNQTF